MHPAIAEIESSAGDVFKTSCMGDEKIDDSAYREQKSKYCDCVADFIYEQQTEMSDGSDRYLQGILSAIELAFASVLPIR